MFGLAYEGALVLFNVVGCYNRITFLMDFLPTVLESMDVSFSESIWQMLLISILFERFLSEFSTRSLFSVGRGFSGSDWRVRVVAALFSSHVNLNLTTVFVWCGSFLLKSDKNGFRSDTAISQALQAS